MNKIIRTPSKAHGGITSVEKEKMDQHAKLWIARAMRTEPINREKITLSIQALYKAANLPLPRVIIVPSPIVMATAGTFAARIIATRNAITMGDGTIITRGKGKFAALYSA